MSKTSVPTHIYMGTQSFLVLLVIRYLLQRFKPLYKGVSRLRTKSYYRLRVTTSEIATVWWTADFKGLTIKAYSGIELGLVLDTGQSWGAPFPVAGPFIHKERQMPDSTKRRDFRGTRGQIEDADPTPSKSKRSPTRRAANTRGTTLDQAKRSERKGRDGERAFGAPFDRQSTDSNN